MPFVKQWSTATRGDVEWGAVVVAVVDRSRTIDFNSQYTHTIYIPLEIVSTFQVYIIDCTVEDKSKSNNTHHYLR